ncbi:protein-L-isoaspartate O-methyltransferase [Streptomyces armeniacus]|uniref:Protein-L-isoaspartate O-methyltransferase n=2 Tax=Streptomyces armeniacus TaxID=83291 RepID=A0A345Y1Q6_9ACTN|nr:protein-L-isoaspartate O-methyltransferase [Streptomyces armeniacus]
MDRAELWPERSPWIRRAVELRPRHDFAPDQLWVWEGHAYTPVERGLDERRWAEVVYGGPYEPTVTQVTVGLASSSLSCCSVVADMLDSLKLEAGHQVLELGTATGWNAALLDHRAGPGRVTSLELDAELAAAARTNLDAAGAQVRVEVADGAAGCPDGAPYDRLIATYAVDRIPWAWVQQVRPGGRIVTPWGRLGHLALTVAEDGASATGWVQGLAMFMPSRTAEPPLAFEQIRRGRAPQHEHIVDRDVRSLTDDPHLRFALRVALPEVRITATGERLLELHDDADSWATLTGPAGDSAGTAAVARQGGPRHLVAEVEDAWDEWLGHGSPELYDYGLTVTDAGRQQYAWAWDRSDGPRWPLPDPEARRPVTEAATATR